MRLFLNSVAMRCLSPTLLLAATASACDNPFAYSYLAETLKQGEREIEQFITGRLGKDLGGGYDARYRAFDLRTELEYGVTAVDQVELTLDQTYMDSASREALRFRGVGLEYIRMLAHPDENPWGRALYLEAIYSQSSPHDGHLRERWILEAKYLLQHNFGPDSDWMYVANLGIEGLHTAGGEDAFELILTQGIACQLTAEWSAGLEAVAASEWLEGAEFEESGVLAGPCLNYRQGGFSTTLTILAQLAGAPSDKGDLNVAEYSPYEVRLVVSCEF